MQDDAYSEARSLLSSNPRKTIQLLSGTGSSSDPEALFLRGVAFFRLGDFASAEGSFRGAIALDATRADAFYYLGLALEPMTRRQAVFGLLPGSRRVYVGLEQRKAAQDAVTHRQRTRRAA